MKRILLPILLFLACSPAWSQAPGSGYALDFNASTDYLSIPNNAALNPTTAFTLEAWIKADSWNVNSWGGVILSKDGWGSGEAGYTLRCGANGTASFMLGTTTSWKEVLSTPQMVLGQWYHLAGTFDGTQLKLYINGVLSGTTNYSGVALASTYDLSIGRITYTAGGTRNFDGQIDEVRIWNTALSQATIQNNLTKKVTNVHPNYANLAGYWKMDEGTGLTTADSGPNNLTGTRMGAPAWGLSAAAIGDANAVVYGSPTTVTVTNTDGSSFAAQVIGGSPTALHVYAVNQTPNTTAENLSGSLETTHYFGTFLVGGTNPSYTATYNYTGVAGLASSTQEQNIRLAYRNNNTGLLWSRLNNQFQLDTALNTTTKCGLTSRREFVAGFDSVRRGVTNSTICQGDTLLYFGQQLSIAGLYTHVTTLPNSCDSTVGVQLSVTPTVSGSASSTICSGDSVLFGTQVLTTAGTYTGTFTAVSGCDSIVTYTLSVTPPSNTNITATICTGHIYTLGTQSLTQSGTYTETFAAINGCDSMVTLALTVTPAPNLNVTASICEGDLYNLGSQNLTQPGTYLETFSNALGCDSTVTLTLSFHVVDTSVSLSGNTLTANLFATSYQWLDCDNNLAPLIGQDGQSLLVTANGHYAVIVYDGVCRDTSGCHFALAVGVRDGLRELLRVSPNPSSSVTHVQRLDGNALGHLQLVAIDGRLVWSADVMDGFETTLDMHHLAAGMYFLRVLVDEQAVVLKVVRE